MKRKKTIRAGKLVKTIIYTTPTIADSSNPRIRGKKQKCSTEARKRMNEIYAYQKLELLIAANFEAGRDCFVTLTYSNDNLPADREDAVRMIKNCLRRMRRQKGKGKKCSLPYIYITEDISDIGEPVRLHHHIIIKHEDLNLLHDNWIYGDIDVRIIDFRNTDNLARYMVKQRRNDNRTGARHWSQSTNLKRPEVTTEICADDADITPPPGAYVISNDSNTYEYGMWRYIKYYLDPPYHREFSFHSRP